MQDNKQDKFLRFLFWGAIGLTSFSGFGFLGHLALAYPGIREGVIWILVILGLGGAALFGLYSAVDMYKARDGYFRQQDLIVSQLPTIGLLVAIGLAVVFGLVVGG